ncbi:MAG: hypothetical protein WA830_14510 [Candidatus Sulfotelmatobacter sp.]
MSRSFSFEIAQRIQETLRLQPQRVAGASDVIEVAAASPRLSNKRRFRDLGCGQVSGRTSQQLGSIGKGKRILCSDGILKTFQEHWTCCGKYVREFAQEFFIAADAV